MEAEAAAGTAAAAAAGDKFPIGMRVLVVDDDPLCLMILKKMLLQCNYNVTTCSRAIEALQLLRERRSKFDLVMSDVYMPDIDGFKLLELVGLEMDLPVIMMSANGETSVVMKGITHGACDYLLKPVRLEELRNIWQHVVRKRGRDVKDESSGEWDESEKPHDTASDLSSKKRKENFEEDQIDSLSGLKKPRVVWSGDLHRLFVKAVNQLGVEKAVPKKILEIMNVQGLSRENVASHLQKYRLGLKRISGVDLEPHPIASFQADESGNLGGSMSIQPPGSKGSCSKSSSSSGVFGKGINQLDPGTLAALKQLQALQHAKVLKSPRALKMRQTAIELHELADSAAKSSSVTSLLNRTCSLDLGSLTDEQWVSSWQQRLPVKQETRAAVEHRPDDFDSLACLKDVRLEDPPLASSSKQAEAAFDLPGPGHDLLLEDDLYFAPAAAAAAAAAVSATAATPYFTHEEQHQHDWY